MSRSIFSGVIGAAVLLGACLVGQQSFGQDQWDHGFGPRNYGYSGNPYAQGYSSRAGYGDPGRYSNQSFYGNQPTHRHHHCRPDYGIGGYSTGYSGGYSSGAYGYSTAPGYYGYRSYYSPLGVGLSIGVVPPTSPYYEPLGVHRHGDTLYAPIPRSRAW